MAVFLLVLLFLIKKRKIYFATKFLSIGVIKIKHPEAHVTELLSRNPDDSIFYLKN